MTRINGRSKGARREREWRDFCCEHYGCTHAERGARNGVRGGEDVMGTIPGTRCEVKGNQSLSIQKAMRQAVGDAKLGQIPYVATKLDRQPWLLTIRAEDLLAFAARVAAIGGKPICPFNLTEQGA